MSNLTTNIFIELISNDGFVATSKHLIRKLGLLEATLIGELCSQHKYWAAKRENFDGWFPSTISNIEKNCGISRKQQKKTVTTLVGLNIVEIKNMGIPAKRHFKINTDTLYKMFEDTDDTTSDIYQCSESDTKPMIKTRKRKKEGISRCNPVIPKKEEVIAYSKTLGCNLLIDPEDFFWYNEIC